MVSEQIKDRAEPQRTVVKRPVVLVAHPAKNGTLWRFSEPKRIIQAEAPDQVESAIAAVNGAVRAGRHVAGWFAYELGYALEPRLAPLGWPIRRQQLLWLGVFDGPTEVVSESLGPVNRAYAGRLNHEWNESAYTARFARARD